MWDLRTAKTVELCMHYKTSWKVSRAEAKRNCCVCGFATTIAISCRQNLSVCKCPSKRAKQDERLCLWQGHGFLTTSKGRDSCSYWATDWQGDLTTNHGAECAGAAHSRVAFKFCVTLRDRLSCPVPMYLTLGACSAIARMSLRGSLNSPWRSVFQYVAQPKHAQQQTSACPSPKPPGVPQSLK
eukprot:5889721-Amphidinium_carterae.1